eukprot:5608309-Pleurochrysis_carterae.AAC.1
MHASQKQRLSGAWLRCHKLYLAISSKMNLAFSIAALTMISNRLVAARSGTSSGHQQIDWRVFRSIIHHRNF